MPASCRVLQEHLETFIERTETATHLVDHLFPRVPVRQGGGLTLPFDPRARIAFDPKPAQHAPGGVMLTCNGSAPSELVAVGQMYAIRGRHELGLEAFMRFADWGFLGRNRAVVLATVLGVMLTCPGLAQAQEYVWREVGQDTRMMKFGDQCARTEFHTRVCEAGSVGKELYVAPEVMEVEDWCGFEALISNPSITIRGHAECDNETWAPVPVTVYRCVCEGEEDISLQVADYPARVARGDVLQFTTLMQASPEAKGTGLIDKFGVSYAGRVSRSEILLDDWVLTIPTDQNLRGTISKLVLMIAPVGEYIVTVNAYRLGGVVASASFDTAVE